MDAIIIGAGFCGSVIARFIAEDLNKKVLLIDRRDHIAGNMYDYRNKHNIFIHKYGPHAFHTNHKFLYDYIIKYGDWEPYKVKCMAYIDGQFTPTPFNFQTIDQYFTSSKASALKEEIQKNYPHEYKKTILDLLNSESKLIKEYADFLFEKDYKIYTAKQWGIPPEEIDISILKRVPVYFSYETDYFDDEYQFMPKHGYTNFFKNIINHNNIDLKLNLHAKDIIKIDNDSVYFENKKTDIPVFYTGAIDELLDYKYGALPYRTLEFDFKNKNIDSYQEAPIVVYPQAKDFTRITEYKKLPKQDIKGVTTIAIEYPSGYEPGSTKEPYYPLLTDKSIEKYHLYKQELNKINNIYACGRLADYRYYNMDQALNRALEVCKTIKI